jgi:hypothetical protein
MPHPEGVRHFVFRSKGNFWVKKEVVWPSRHATPPREGGSKILNQKTV